MCKLAAQHAHVPDELCIGMIMNGPSKSGKSHSSTL